MQAFIAKTNKKLLEFAKPCGHKSYFSHSIYFNLLVSGLCMDVDFIYLFIINQLPVQSPKGNALWGSRRVYKSVLEHRKTHALSGLHGRENLILQIRKMSNKRRGNIVSVLVPVAKQNLVFFSRMLGASSSDFYPPEIMKCPKRKQNKTKNRSKFYRSERSKHTFIFGGKLSRNVSQTTERPCTILHMPVIETSRGKLRKLPYFNLNKP